MQPLINIIQIVQDHYVSRSTSKFIPISNPSKYDMSINMNKTKHQRQAPKNHQAHATVTKHPKMTMVKDTHTKTTIVMKNRSRQQFSMMSERLHRNSVQTRVIHKQNRQPSNKQSRNPVRSRWTHFKTITCIHYDL